MKSTKKSRKAPTATSLLGSHFKGVPLHKLVSSSRVFPLTARVDLQAAIEGAIEQHSTHAGRTGVQSEFSHETLSFAAIATATHYVPHVAPLEFEEVDIGGAQPARCLKNCLFLCKRQKDRFAVLLTPKSVHGRHEGLVMEVAIPPGATDISRILIDDVEKHLAKAQSYRGKVISLERLDNYSGTMGGVRVHKLRSVSRDQVILPDKTLQLLDRNVGGFIRMRDRLQKLKMGVKKGLLFYGPPGTGKTHTIHYLASCLPDHTTLLITAAEVGLLSEYFQLARFLQPAMIVLEDVDLIARSRERMNGPCEESLLNRLLNEMDGLREEAQLLFVLTTNRPQDLEAALASRPGRVDQAIEFPLPDDAGRRKLITLYSGGMNIAPSLMETVVSRTRHSSAAFIKELMRRSAQYLLESGGTKDLQICHVEDALTEMLFAGGMLNVKLLGGAASDPGEPSTGTV